MPSPPGSVQPRLDAADRGRRAARLQFVGAVRAVVEVAVLVGDEPAEPERLRGLIVVGQVALQLRGVVGQQPLQLLRHVEDQPHGEGEHRDARGDPQAPLAGAERAYALDHAAPGEGEHEKRHRDSDRE